MSETAAGPVKVQIKHRYTDAVLFECDAPEGLESGLHVRHALEKATKSRAYLSRAYLSGANLSGADLSGAYLSGAKLIGERPVFQIGPIGSRCDYFVAYITNQGIKLLAGCFFGTVQEFREKLAEEHGDNKHAKEYNAALEMIDVHAEIWTPSEVTQEVA
jgi:uncharacterized protein YjbI with pentapeptide repeats